MAVQCSNTIERGLTTPLMEDSDAVHQHLQHDKQTKRRFTPHRFSTESFESVILGIGKTRHKSGLMHEVWLFMNAEASDDGIRKWAGWYEIFSIGLVVALVVMDILDSVKSIAYSNENNALYHIFIRFACCIFTLEYVLRVWSCLESEDFARWGACLGRLKYILSLLPLIDLCVLVAFFLDIFEFSSSDFVSVLRMIRLLRILALLKLERSTNSFRSIYKVFILKKAELVATLFTACVMMVVSSTLMYYLENPVQPEKFPNILVAMWWGVTALTTVGYGDIYPVTPLGKFTASVVAFFGVGLFALPAGILGSGFVEILQEEQGEANPAVSGVFSRGVESMSMDTLAAADEIRKLQNSVAEVKNDMGALQKQMQESTQALSTKVESLLANQAYITEMLKVQQTSMLNQQLRIPVAQRQPSAAGASALLPTTGSHPGHQFIRTPLGGSPPGSVALPPPVGASPFGFGFGAAPASLGSPVPARASHPTAAASCMSPLPSAGRVVRSSPTVAAPRAKQAGPPR